jgi:hypothetical protein
MQNKNLWIATIVFDINIVKLQIEPFKHYWCIKGPGSSRSP